MSGSREDLKALITQGLEAKHDYGDGYAVAMIAEDLADALRDALAERDKALAERDASREVNAEFLAAQREPIVDDHEVCTTELAAAHAVIEQVKAVRSDYPVCEKHPDDDVITCGWKRAVQGIDWVLAGGEA